MLTVSHLSLTYPCPSPSVISESTLKDLSFTLSAGDRIALVGANGAGKSSLLLTLIGVLSPQEGEISLGELSLTKKTLPAWRDKIGMIFQNPDDQLFMPTVYEDVAFGPRNGNLPEEEIAADVEEMLTQLGIPHLKERFSHQLSGGEKRLVALASVLIMRPDLLLMDEPSSFLDPKSRRRLIEILVELEQPMILATHDLDLALQVCHRVILLQEGRIVVDGPAQEVLTNEVLLLSCGLELPLSLQGLLTNRDKQVASCGADPSNNT